MASAWGVSFGVAWGDSWGATGAVSTPTVTASVGGVSPRVWRQGIQTYLRRLEAEQEAEVRAEIKQVKAQAKKAIRETEELPPIPRLVIEQPQFQYLVDRANADILATAEAALRAVQREIARRQEEDDEDIALLLH